MKISNLFLASTALPLMLLSANASTLPSQVPDPVTLAQAEPAEPGQLPPRARPGRGGDDAQPERRQGRPGSNEEGGPRGQRGGGQGGGAEAPRAPRATSPDDGPAAPRPNREQRPPAERPAAPDSPSRPSPAPAERAQPPADAPARPQRPSAQEREPTPREQAPAERPRSPQAPDTPARPAAPPAARPAAPPVPSQEQRTAPSAPRPADTGRPGRDDPGTPDQQRAPSAPPAAAQPPAPSRPTPPAAPAPAAPAPAPVAPQTQPSAPPSQPTPPAPAAPQARPGAAAPVAPQQAAPSTTQPLDASRVRIEDLRSQRRERREGDRVIIEEPGNRTIIREGNDVIIRHDESERFRRVYGADDVRVERRGGNEEVTIVRRPDGSEIVSVRDEYGNLVRRVRREPAGREVVLIENRRGGIGPARPGYGYVEEDVLRLAPPTVRIPREEYIVETESASEADIVEAFTAPPVERIERAYTLDEVRRSQPLRQRMRRVDVDTINFEFGSWELPGDQVRSLGAIAEGLRQAISRNPNEIFLVEGHTDAVGSNEDNLTLSDRRAETVATILSQQFQIPAENLTTQGYGEEYLKVNSQGPEQRNRRATLRRITPLLQGQNQQ